MDSVLLLEVRMICECKFLPGWDWDFKAPCECRKRSFLALQECTEASNVKGQNISVHMFLKESCLEKKVVYSETL